MSQTYRNLCLLIIPYANKLTFRNGDSNLNCNYKLYYTGMFINDFSFFTIQ